MAHSDPVLRERIVEKVKTCGELVIMAESMPELKQKLGVPYESNGRVDQALRSLTYKKDYRPKGVRYFRPRSTETGLRGYRVSYAGA